LLAPRHRLDARFAWPPSIAATAPSAEFIVMTGVFVAAAAASAARRWRLFAEADSRFIFHDAFPRCSFRFSCFDDAALFSDCD